MERKENIKQKEKGVENMFGKNKFVKVVKEKEIQPEEMEDIEEVEEEQPKKIIRTVPVAPRAPQQSGYKPLAEKQFEIGEIKAYPIEVKYTVVDESGEEIPCETIAQAKVLSYILKA